MMILSLRFVSIVCCFGCFVCEIPIDDQEDRIPVAQIKETASGAVISEFDWSVSNVRHLLQHSHSPHGETVPGPEFYTGRPGYKVRLSLTIGRVNPADELPYLGVWFSLVPGIYDEVLEWPFQYTLNLTLLSRTDPSQSLHLSMNPMTAICRLRKQFLRPRLEGRRRGEGCGRVFFITHDKLLTVDPNGLGTYLVGDEMVLRATIFLQGQAPKPRRARVFMRGHQLVSEFLWEVENVDGKRPLGQVTSDLFHLNSDSYLMVMQLSFSGNDIGLYATLVPGDFDESLQWPFPYTFELAIVDPSPAGQDRRGTVDPSAGTCPLAAFIKPKYQPNVPCGFRRLATFSMIEAKKFKRNGNLLVKFSAVLDNMPQSSKLSMRDNFLVAEYTWRVSSIERKMQLAKADRLTNLLSEKFYSSEQGYLLQLQIKFQNRSDGYIGLFLTILEGEHDPLLEWPFSKKFSLIVVDQQDAGAGDDVGVSVDPSDPYIRSEACAGSFWRPFGRNDACGSSSTISYDHLYQRKFIRYGAVLFKVVIYMHELMPPRFATLSVAENQFVARFEWPITHIMGKIREARDGRLSYIDSDKFYVSNNGYRMMLRLYPEKAEGFMGLYAVLTKGAYDDELRWPFPYNYRLEVISSSAPTIGRTTYPGTSGSGCPDIAFHRPERELAEWSCGEGHMVAQDTVLTGGYVDAKGTVKFAVTVFLQELSPPVAAITFERGVLLSKYSWIIKDVEASLELLRSREKNRLESPLFYSENQGYAMQLSLSLGQSPSYRNLVVSPEKEDTQMIGLYWTLHSGQHDDVVRWPYSSVMALTLVDKVDPGRSLEKIIDPARSKCPREAFERPRKAHNEHSCGFAAFVGLDSLMSSFVFNKVLHIRVSIIQA